MIGFGSSEKLLALVPLLHISAVGHSLDPNLNVEGIPIACVIVGMFRGSLDHLCL